MERVSDAIHDILVSTKNGTYSKLPFWGGTHVLTQLKNELWENYIPDRGASDYVESECLLAIFRIAYDYYNNGFCNNLSDAAQYLIIHSDEDDKYLTATLQEILPFTHNHTISIPQYTDLDFTNKLNYVMVWTIYKLVKAIEDKTLRRAEINGCRGIPPLSDIENCDYNDDY